MSHPCRLCPHCRTVAPMVGAVCRVCWQYRYRHGTLPDTAALAARWQRGAYGECRTCGGPTVPHARAQGRCGTCRAYSRRLGQERRAAGMPGRSSPWCINCGQARQRYRRCEACRAYFRRRGQERPARLWARRDERMGIRPSDYCIVCGHRRQRYRRCEACRAYWEKYCVERPRHLWDPPPRVLECWCGVPVFAAVPRRGLCALHYRQDLAQRKAAGAPLQGWGA